MLKVIPDIFLACFSFRAPVSWRTRTSLFMLVLFLVELGAFMSTSVDTSVILDTNSDTQLRINFNITLMDLSCEFAAIDVYDVLGTNTQVRPSLKPLSPIPPSLHNFAPTWLCAHRTSQKT